MIKYSLKCDQDHAFESWFANAEAFDTLKAAGHVACPSCGSARVEKALMAPKVTPARKAASVPRLTGEITPQEKALAEMRKHVEENSDYVGGNFAKEARAMHDGDVPDRAIHGEASFKEAKALVEDGVPVVPLPFAPKAKQN